MKNKEFVFVIMPFDDEFTQVYQGVIKPTIEGCGLECKRVDDKNHPDHIVGKIMEYIHEARVMIADITNLKPGVVYELGIAHATANNTIIITQNRKQNELFHLNGYRIIEYKTDIAGGINLGAELKRLIEEMDEWQSSPNNPVQQSREKNKDWDLKRRHTTLQKAYDMLRQQFDELQQKSGQEQQETVPQKNSEVNKTKVNQLVVEGDLSGAINYLLDNTKKNDLSNRLTSLAGELEGYQNDFRVGILSREDYDKTLNRIRLAILELSDKI